VLKELYGEQPADEFGPISLTSVQNAFVQKGHCRRYVNQNVGRIKRMFKWAVAIVTPRALARLFKVLLPLAFQPDQKASARPSWPPFSKMAAAGLRLTSAEDCRPTPTPGLSGTIGLHIARRTPSRISSRRLFFVGRETGGEGVTLCDEKWVVWDPFRPRN
jgi:hypothetical protein